jgi:hypothetical protein
MMMPFYLFLPSQARRHARGSQPSGESDSSATLCLNFRKALQKAARVRRVDCQHLYEDAVAA